MRAPALLWLSHPYPSGVLFGLIFGAMVGTIVMSVASGYMIIRGALAGDKDRGI